MTVMIAVIAENKKSSVITAIVAIIWKLGLRGLQNADICNFSGSLKPGFHMIATIAVIAAIAEKNKSSAIEVMIAIMWKPLSSYRSDNDR